MHGLAQRLELACVHVFGGQAIAACELDELADAGVVAPGRNAQAQRALRTPQQKRAHRVQTVNRLALWLHSSTSSRSMSPSMGLTAVTTTLIWPPARRRRPCPRPRQP